MSDTFTPGEAIQAPSPTTSSVNPSPAAATPAATPQPATPAAPATPVEDRSNWIPPHRWREAQAKNEQVLNQLRAQAEAEKAALQRQLQALTGVLPPENPEIDQVKNQFKQVFPELHELGSSAEAIKELIALKDELRAAMQNQWATHNRNAINTLYEAAEATYGSPLNEDARRELGSAFVGHLQANPDAYERYQQDPIGVVRAYWSAFTDRFISPIQRAQTVATQNRIPGAIPQDPSSGALPVSTPVKPANVDERLQAALNVYKAKQTTGF